MATIREGLASKERSLTSQHDSSPPSSLSPSGLLSGSTHLSLTEAKPRDPCATPSTEGGVTPSDRGGAAAKTCLSGQTLRCARCVQADRLRFDQEPGGG